MKTIGALGGMSHESTKHYYEIMNNEVQERLGGLNSAEMLISSVNFEIIDKLMKEKNWESIYEIIIKNAKVLENAGVDFLMIFTNTMHRFYDRLEKELNIPILHIADATGQEIVNSGIKNILLLGTNTTMSENFYKDRLIDKYNINVLIPDEDDRKRIDDVIFNELCKGEATLFAENDFIEIIKKFSTKVGGVILGCTEIGMIVSDKNSPVKVFDTAEIHAKAGVNLALK